MGGLLLPLLLLVGGYIYYAKLGGKEQLDSILGDLKGGGGGSDFSISGGGAKVDVQLPQGMNDLLQKAQSRTGSWTDERGNNFNNQSGSGSQVNRQSNVGKSGSIIQKQSNVFYTIPRFGNL